MTLKGQLELIDRCLQELQGESVKASMTIHKGELTQAEAGHLFVTFANTISHYRRHLLFAIRSLDAPDPHDAPRIN